MLWHRVLQIVSGSWENTEGMSGLYWSLKHILSYHVATFFFFFCKILCFFLIFFFFSLESWRCYLSLSQQPSACIFALILHGSALWTFSTLSRMFSKVRVTAAQWCCVTGSWAEAWGGDREPESTWIRWCRGCRKLEMWSQLRKVFIKNRGNKWTVLLWNRKFSSFLHTLFYSNHFFFFMILYLYQYTDYKN